MSFPQAIEQMAVIRRDAVEIEPEEELVRTLARSLKTGEPLRLKQGFHPPPPDPHIGGVLHQQRGVPDDVRAMGIAASEEGLGAEGGQVWPPRLLARAGLAPSTSQAVRLIQQREDAVDGEKLGDREAAVEVPADYLLQSGTRQFVRVS